ncbi:MAG: lipA [Candidatus Brocadiaceae bacterium]|nr:lipA [Candidatus Brocadiaceae bacterium]
MRPDWLKVRLPAGSGFLQVKNVLRERNLHTVCEEAVCPNIGECFERGTATFLILGDVCTRECGFCAVKKGHPSGVDGDEPRRIAGAVMEMKLNYAVITSVTRDDLPDGGASVYALTIQAIRERCRNCKVEVLIPDFAGSPGALEAVIQAQPDVLNHNLETVPRLYPRVRPFADYARSLSLLQDARKGGAHVTTKSGLMAGFGETWEELLQTMRDIRDTGCDRLTLGQYLRPNKDSLPIHRYYTPAEFNRLRMEGERMGFNQVTSGPLVRSSYYAERPSDSVCDE